MSNDRMPIRVVWLSALSGILLISATHAIAQTDSKKVRVSIPGQTSRTSLFMPPRKKATTERKGLTLNLS